MASPFHTYAGILERAPHLIHVSLRNDPQVVGYQFWGQSTINGAYGNPAGGGVGGAGSEAMFEVDRDIFFRSATLRRKGLAAYPENRKGTTQAAFDLDDFTSPGSDIPPDDQWLFLRVQENRRGVGLLTVPGPLPVLGGIYCIPPASAYGSMSPSFTQTGTAPSSTGSVAGSPPLFSEDLTSADPRPMYLVFSHPLTEFTLRNQDGANGLLVALGVGQPMTLVPAGQDLQLFTGGTKEMILACPDAGGCPFSLHGVLGRS